MIPSTKHLELTIEKKCWLWRWNDSVQFCTKEMEMKSISNNIYINWNRTYVEHEARKSDQIKREFNNKKKLNSKNKHKHSAAYETMWSNNVKVNLLLLQFPNSNVNRTTTKKQSHWNYINSIVKLPNQYMLWSNQIR